MTAFSYYVVVNHSLKIIYEPHYELMGAEQFKADLLTARPGDQVDIVEVQGTVVP